MHGRRLMAASMTLFFQVIKLGAGVVTLRFIFKHPRASPLLALKFAGPITRTLHVKVFGHLPTHSIHKFPLSLPLLQLRSPQQLAMALHPLLLQLRLLMAEQISQITNTHLMEPTTSHLALQTQQRRSRYLASQMAPPIRLH